MTYHLKKKNLKGCGCVYKDKPKYKKGKIVVDPKILITECFQHQKQREEKERLKKELKKFPNLGSKKIFKMLDRMLDELSEFGPKVLYLSDKDKLILRKYAIKINSLYLQ